MLFGKVEELVQLKVKAGYSVIMKLRREPRPIRGGIITAQLADPVLLLPEDLVLDVVSHAADPDAREEEHQQRLQVPPVGIAMHVLL